MNSLMTVTRLVAVCLLLSSCAASYRPIEPNTLHYPESSESTNFWYKYDVLMQTHNRKFAKKEMKTMVNVVAVKIFNNTGQTLKYGVNYRIYSGDKEVDILPPNEILHYVKETVPTYLLYLLLTPTTLRTTDATSTHSFPIGLILGPAIAGVNVGVAATANSHFRTELEQYNLDGKEIKDGETVYGLIGIQSRDIAPLKLKLN